MGTLFEWPIKLLCLLKTCNRFGTVSEKSCSENVNKVFKKCLQRRFPFLYKLQAVSIKCYWEQTLTQELFKNFTNYIKKYSYSEIFRVVTF